MQSTFGVTNMIEVWTEDNGAGYKLIREVISTIYGSSGIKVVPHKGNGWNGSSDRNSGNGVLFDLRNSRNNNNSIVIVLDMALDNDGVTKVIMDIKHELNLYHKDKVRVVTGLYCFEYGVLTYKDLARYGGMERNDLGKDIACYLSCIGKRGFDCDKALKLGSGYFRYLGESIRNRSGEKIGKVLLSLATTKANIELKDKKVHGAVIKDMMLGCCWTCNCCKYESAEKLRCDSSIRGNLGDKITELAFNSEFKQYIYEIDTFIKKRLSKLYDSSKRSRMEISCQSFANKYLSNRRNAVIFLDYAERVGFWNCVMLKNLSGRL